MRIFLYRFFFLFAFVTMLSLAVWQVQRFYQKRNLIDDIQTKALVMHSEDDLVSYSTNDLLFSKLDIEGHFLKNKNIFLYGRYKNTYVLVSPLITKNNKTLIVIRGLIKGDNLENYSSELKLENLRSVNIEGFILPFDKPSMFLPENKMDKKIWFSLTEEDFKKYLGQDILPFYLLQTSVNDSEYLSPLPINLSEKIHNNHLGYAVTWLGLAITLVIIICLKQKESNHSNP